LEVWPNPAREQIHVRFYMDDGRFYKDLGLEIYDVFGRQAPTPALPQPGEGGGWIVDVSAFPSGIYIAILKDSHRRLYSRKFVILR